MTENHSVEKIVSTKKQKDSNFLNSEYTLYTFKVITPFNSWFISKRYSQMKDFYDYLKKLYPKLDFPPFPPKKWFSTKESTIIERRNAFEELFLYVIQYVDILKYKKLKQFFKIKKNIIAIYIKNCILINDNKVSFDLIDEESSSSSIEVSSGSNGSNKSNNEKDNEKNKDFENFIKIKPKFSSRGNRWIGKRKYKSRNASNRCRSIKSSY